MPFTKANRAAGRNFPCYASCSSCSTSHPPSTRRVRSTSATTRTEALVEKDETDPEQMEERNTQLAIYWCAKEALYKRMDRNNVDFSRDMEVDRFSVREEGEIDVVFKYPKSEQNDEEEFEMNYEVFEDHVMVWMVG